MLVTRVRHPSLGLGISVRSSTPCASSSPGHRGQHRRVGSIPSRRCARGPPGTPFLRRVIESLRSLLWPRALERRRDRARVQDQGAVPEVLDSLNSYLDDAQRSIAFARDVITPPTALDIDLGPGTSSRIDSAGALRRRPSIIGKLDTTKVEVALQFDERQRQLGARVRGRSSDGPRRVREAKLAMGSANGRLWLEPARLGALLAAWPDDVTDLEIADGVAAARYPRPVVGPMRRACASVRTLQSALAALDETVGPYR